MTRIDLNGDWIEVKEVEPGAFVVTADSMTNEEFSALGIYPLDDEVEDLDDHRSDAYQRLDIVLYLRWKDVTFDFGGEKYEIFAPSLERVNEALGHVGIFAWCPEDI